MFVSKPTIGLQANLQQTLKFVTLGHLSIVHCWGSAVVKECRVFSSDEQTRRSVSYST